MLGFYLEWRSRGSLVLTPIFGVGENCGFLRLMAKNKILPTSGTATPFAIKQWQTQLLAFGVRCFELLLTVS
jgi:hypothetical protein